MGDIVETYDMDNSTILERNNKVNVNYVCFGCSVCRYSIARHILNPTLELSTTLTSENV